MTYKLFLIKTLHNDNYNNNETISPDSGIQIKG